MTTGLYELIDFGGGRKLESIAGHLIDRPSPAADTFTRHHPGVWNDVDARFDAESKTWTHFRQWPDLLMVDCGKFRMPVQPTPFGHIGIFPEQASNWRWLARPYQTAKSKLNALNLFAYTGASTMALVAAGFAVAHVDAAKPNVTSAKTAADVNGWTAAPIRYLVDDAAKFAAREVRRGRRYHTIVLDPPAYGHSPRGTAWRIERDLWPLLDDCFRLLDPSRFRLLVTGHSPQVDGQDVIQYLRATEFWGEAEERTALLLDSGRSQLTDRYSRCLDTGFFVRLESA